MGTEARVRASEMCTVAARAYQTCMRQKGRIGGHTKSAPQQTKYSIRKNKLRKPPSDFKQGNGGAASSKDGSFLGPLAFSMAVM